MPFCNLGLWDDPRIWTAHILYVWNNYARHAEDVLWLDTEASKPVLNTDTIRYDD